MWLQFKQRENKRNQEKICIYICLLKHKMAFLLISKFGIQVADVGFNTSV